MVPTSSSIWTIRDNMIQKFILLIFFMSGYAFEFPINYDEQANRLFGNEWVQRFSTVLNKQPPDLYRKRFRAPYF